MTKLLDHLCIFLDVTECTTCTVGHYCPYGGETSPTTEETECPMGTYNPYNGTVDRRNCILCDAGKACTQPGLEFPDADCAQVTTDLRGL